jgi:hypothetical protein
LGTSFSDGRTTYSLLRRGPRRTLTPKFPKLAGAAGRQSAVTELIVSSDLQGDLATVSLAVRAGQSDEQSIATVTVGPTDKVTVNTPLAEVGLAPIQFFQTLVKSPSVPDLPTAECTPDSLRASVSIRETDESLSLDVAVSNAAPVGVRAVSFLVFRDGHMSASGGQRGHEGEPLIAAKDRFVLPVPISIGASPSGQVTFFMPEKIVIRSALGTDGALLGDPGPALDAWLRDLGSRPQAERLASAFRDIAKKSDTPEAMLAALDASIGALPIEAEVPLVARAMLKVPTPGMMPEARVRTALQSALRELKDNGAIALADFRKGPTATDPDALHRWLESQAARYESWAARLPK